jgi:hypothetical protein
MQIRALGSDTNLQNSRTQELKNSRTPELQNSRTPELRTPEFRTPELPNAMVTLTPELD